jgi:hypothetical protein
LQQPVPSPKTTIQQSVKSTNATKCIRSVIETSDAKYRLCLYESDSKPLYFILKIWDIQNKNNPIKLGSVSFYGTQFHNLCISDDNQFCIINFDKHYIIDIQNKHSPIILSPSFGLESDIACLVLNNQYFASSSHDGGFCLYAIHNKTAPQLMKEIPPRAGFKIQNIMAMPDEKYIVTFSENPLTQSTLLELWNIENIQSPKVTCDMTFQTKHTHNHNKNVILTPDWKFKLADGTIIDFPEARESLIITAALPKVVRDHGNIPKELSSIILEMAYPFFKAKKTSFEQKHESNLARKQI